MKKKILFTLIILGSFSSIHCQISNTLRTGTLIDERDGFKYNWVKIGDQVWMAENLRYYTTDERSAFSNQSLKDAQQYGRTYSLQIAQEVCPDGWHLPNLNEWYSLINSFGEVFNENGDISHKGMTKDERKVKIQRIHEAYSLLEDGGASGFNVLNIGNSDAPFWTSDIITDKGASKNLQAYAFYFRKTAKTFYVTRVRNKYYFVRCVKNK